MFILEQIIKLALAAFCGFIIGYERTKRLKDAGIRTHCIIAIASALIMIVSKYGFADMVKDGVFLFGTTGVDPSRIAAQVVTGICFVGAGVIFRNGDSLKGLSTASGIWATAGIGLAIGTGMYIIGCVATVMIVIIQILFHRINIGYDAYSENDILIEFTYDEETENILKQLEAKKDIQIRSITIKKSDNQIINTYRISYKYNTNAKDVLLSLKTRQSTQTIKG